MGRFHYDRYPLGLQETLEGVGDLGGEAFLHLQAAGIHFADAGDFGKANPFAVGNVGHMGATQDGQNVVLTGAKQVNITH